MQNKTYSQKDLITSTDLESFYGKGDPVSAINNNFSNLKTIIVFLRAGFPPRKEINEKHSN